MPHGRSLLQSSFLGRHGNASVDPATMDMVAGAVRTTITMVCPYKALEKQKRFMRCKMRKPNYMRILQFVNHLY
jgi:hypothetical protein